MGKLKDATGLGLFYRLAWRLEYVFVTFVGPAQQDGAKDPKARLRLDRAERIAAAHERRGQPVPASIRAMIDAGGVRSRRGGYSPEAWEQVGRFKGEDRPRS